MIAVERIRVRITAPPETLRYGSLFDENALAKALREADAALPLPEWLRQRIGLSDGHAISLLDNLSISETPSYDVAHSLPLPSKEELASELYHHSELFAPAGLQPPSKIGLFLGAAHHRERRAHGVRLFKPPVLTLFDSASSYTVRIAFRRYQAGETGSKGVKGH